MNFIISNIKTYIDDKGLTYKDFGSIIGKKSSVVGSYMRGEAQISIDSLIKFADEIGETLDNIVFKDWQKTYTKDANTTTSIRNSLQEETMTYQTKNKAPEPIDFNKILQSLQHIGELRTQLERIAADNKKIHEKLELLFLAEQGNTNSLLAKKDTKNIEKKD